MPRFRNLTAGEIRTKSGPHDLVTKADEACERAVVAALARVCPGVCVVGEEAASEDASLLPAVGGAEWCFVLDPIDGTANFASGLPLFGTMLALLHRGEPVAAWVHDPVLLDTAMALRGEGAWVEDRHGRRHDLHVAAPAPLAAMRAAISHRFLPAELAARVRPRLGVFGAGWELRCAAHEWRLAASGQIHALLYWKLMPWDHAPGVLLHAEAGGHAILFDGRRYHGGVHGGGLIAAPDRACLEAVREALLAP
jgi:fructose-1,6-bisphosphatase/inositol monophosphatase family enzyme